MTIFSPSKEDALFKYSQYYSVLVELSIEIASYYNIKLRTVKKDSSYKIYPISIAQEDIQNIMYKVLRKIANTHYETDRPIEDLILEKIEDYKAHREKLAITLKNSSIMPYYGQPEFICTRIKFIIYHIQKLYPYIYNFKYILNFIDEFQERYPKVGHELEAIYPYYDNQFKKDYEKLEAIYLKILALEKELTKEIKSIWKRFLTDPNRHNNYRYAYIVHTFSESLINPKKMKKACCTLATNRLLTIPYGTCGIIYEYDPESIVTMCTENARSWLITKEQFIDYNLPISWQLTKEGVFFESPYLSTLILPEDFERIVIANNIAYNGELLNYDLNLFYSEIFLNKNAKPIGVFYTDEHKNLKELEEYARDLELPLVPLSLRRQREIIGLPLKRNLSVKYNNKY